MYIDCIDITGLNNSLEEVSQTRFAGYVQQDDAYIHSHDFCLPFTQPDVHNVGVGQNRPIPKSQEPSELKHELTSTKSGCLISPPKRNTFKKTLPALVGFPPKKDTTGRDLALDPPRHISHDRRLGEGLGTKFDVVLVDPPWEECAKLQFLMKGSMGLDKRGVCL